MEKLKQKVEDDLSKNYTDGKHIPVQRAYETDGFF